MSDFLKNLSQLSNTDISSSIVAADGSTNNVGSFNVPASTNSSGVKNTVVALNKSKNIVKSFTAHPPSSNVSAQKTNVGKVYYETVKVLENKTNVQNDKIYFEVENVSISCDRTLVEESMDVMKHLILCDNPDANYFQIFNILPVVFNEIIKYVENKNDAELDLTYKDEIIKSAELLGIYDLVEKMTTTNQPDNVL